MSGGKPRIGSSRGSNNAYSSFFFKKNDYVWKRCRRIIKKVASEEEIKTCIERIALFLELASQGLIDIYFCDESGFNLQSNIPYCYQKKGTQLGIPSAKKRVMNVLGFLNPLTDELVTYPLAEKERMKSPVFIRFMDAFAQRNERPKVVILDNASWHKSEETKSRFQDWEKQGLYLYFLPPRCPHFNLIETLWRKIKYEWLSPADFYSENTLKKKLIHIFKHYGEEFKINFSCNIFKTRFN